MINRIIDFGICLVVFILPLYLIQFKIYWIPVTLLELTIYLLFIVWLFHRLKHKSFTSFPFVIFIPIFFILFGITIATLFSENLRISAGIFKGWFIAPLLFFVVLINHLKNKKQIKDLFLALLFSGLGVSLIALFYWFTNQLTYDGRLRAFYLSPNHLAMYLSPILILSLYLYSCFEKKIYRISLFIIHCLFLVVIYLTHSYGAWLSILLTLIFLLFALGKFRSTILSKKIIIVFVLLVLVGVISQIPSQKVQDLFDFSYRPLESRIIIWQSAWEIIKDHPLIGIGPGMFQKYYLDYQPKFAPYLEWAVPQPHNFFLAFWLQTGLIGVLGLLWLLGVFFIRAFKSKYLMSIFLIAVMIYILAHGLIDTTYWKNDLAVIFWLITALGYNNKMSVYHREKTKP